MALSGPLIPTMEERTTVLEACCRFLEEWLRVIEVHWPDLILPTKDEHYFFFEQDGSGGYPGKYAVSSDVDWSEVWEVLRDEATPKFETRAVTLLEKYVAKRGIVSSIGGRLHDVRGSYLMPLLPEYWLRSKGSLRKRSLVKNIIGRMLSSLDATYYEVEGLIVLDGFTAAQPFGLGKGIVIRPFGQGELRILGQTDSPSTSSRSGCTSASCRAATGGCARLLCGARGAVQTRGTSCTRPWTTFRLRFGHLRAAH